MQRLKQFHLVQFFLFEAQTLEIERTTAIIAPNGAGKSALLDALQIVLFGADRNQIRFNAQAGGTHRARSIRDYCLGVFREGDTGRARAAATTYLTMVFTGDDGRSLTVGVSMGASVDEPEHRIYGWYLLPGVELTLDEHFEKRDGQDIPLAWRDFSAMAAARCKQAGTVATLPPSAERFVDDLLKRLRPPNAFADPSAYRKALRNALNLQKVDDVDLFVRASIAEDRPTDIARFRALLEGFRQIKELIEKLEARIQAAQAVEKSYQDIGRLSVRAASYRALGAVYVEERLAEDIDAAEQAVAAAEAALAGTQRALAQHTSALAAAVREAQEARDRLHQQPGYGAQQTLDRLVAESASHAGSAVKQLAALASQARLGVTSVPSLGLAGCDEASLAEAEQPWQVLYETVVQNKLDDIVLPDPEAWHGSARTALRALKGAHDALDAKVHALRSEKDAADQRERVAMNNLKRAVGGKAELRSEVSRLQEYLAAAGIDAIPVCDVTQVSDPSWQSAIEAYLRSHIEALLIAPEHEQRAVALYRNLRGGQAVYGVKLALASHARRHRDSTDAASVASLIEGTNADAVAYLRSQLGALRRIETDQDAVRHTLGLSMDGMLAKGGSVERLRLPSAGELKIGASQTREQRQRLEREREWAAQKALETTRELDRIERACGPLRALRDIEPLLTSFHAALLTTADALATYQRHRSEQREGQGEDLVVLSEAFERATEKAKALQDAAGKAQRDIGAAEQVVANAHAAKERLEAQVAAVRASAGEARRDAFSDPHLVDRLRQELDEKYEALQPRIDECERKAAEAKGLRDKKLPDAWATLTSYAAQHNVPFELLSDDWQGAGKLIAAELKRMVESELVEHRAQAEQAYSTSVSTFRTNVASALYDNFSRLKDQIQSLNQTLRSSPAFSNNERYEFRYEVVPELKTLHAFVEKVGEVGDHDTLFGNAGDVPAVFRDIIDDRTTARTLAASPLDDYRLFFRFEVVIKSDGAVVGTLSKRMRSGSGGEHRAPLYVIAGASLAAAYGKQRGTLGGLGLILLDEFGDKIDAQNARAVTDYLRSLGLQLVVAAPDTAQGTLAGVLDNYIELFRDGDFVQVNQIRVQPAARELMESDQFAVHPELLEREVAQVLAEQALNRERAADA
jgi:chromosome segregation protein